MVTSNDSGRLIASANGVEHQDVLKVESIDLCLNSNGEKHHTDKYNLMTRKTDKCLVVRRGQAFQLDIVLNRAFDVSKDAVSFVFNVADIKTRGPSSDTSVIFPLSKNDSETFGTWTAFYENHVGKHLVVSITPAADCIVAPWRLEVDTKVSGGGSFSYRHALPIYVLFNPWCSCDSVYMPDEDQRYEYVMETGGLLFNGSHTDVSMSPWNYAQFEKDILECAIYLVKEIGKVKGKARSDPILTARGLGAAVNSNDDNGVLAGNWSSNMEAYSDGTFPWKWVGSLVILQKYYETKIPVKYAQCWVFAAVLTTVCRTLGIPCRPVTGFNAAHDGDESLTIDEITDEDGDSDKPQDSIWNFHVWNEVWMERPDLGSEYKGWQVLDSTPQEMSDYIFRCGPTSLVAVRNGEVQKPYDTGYVFAEVNADVVYWKKNGETLKFVGYDPTIVGKYLSTKTVGKMEREDVTDKYKHPDGSNLERLTIVNALRLSKNDTYARYYLNEAYNDDITISIKLLDEVKIGQDFNVAVDIKNTSTTESRQVKGSLRVDRITNTGVVGDLVKKEHFNMYLKPNSKLVVKMLVKFKDYYKDSIADLGSFKMMFVATDVDQEFDFFSQEYFRVRNPDIEMSIEGTPVVGQEFNVTAKVKNTLPIPLTKCKFYIQGSGMDEQLKVQLEEDVKPNQFATAQFKLTSRWTGNSQISAKFQSWEMRDVDGYINFIVN